MKKINWKYVKLARWIVRHIDHDFYKLSASILGSMLITAAIGIFLYISNILWMIVGIFMILLAIWEIRFYNYISVEWANNKINGDMNDELTKRLWKQI
jgi:hypothetical protein